MEDMGKGLSKLIKERNLESQYDSLMKEVLRDEDVISFIEENREKLTDERIVRSYAKLYEYVQEKKKFQRKDGMMAPGYMPKLFMNFHVIDVTYVPTTELIAKQKENEIRERIHSMDMPKDVRNATLAKFELTDERREAVSEALDFIDSYLSDPKGFHKSLYLQGSFGVGKTYLLGALAHELAKNGYASTLMHFPSFAVEMKQSIGKNDMSEKLDMVKKSAILMLDDIGADSMSSWIRDDVLGVILQYRMQEQLPTFFSSNFDMKQLENEHLRTSQRGEDEPLKAKRIMERIRYLAKEIKMTGKNRRNG
ncbi:MULTISPECIES: primosomal protein DnaI [Carnobacterium]|uniref:primosomal protein DnaI n=1 Tax=Carnobacterium TaxID=2747 RepID=UPI000D4DFBC1|nr:MULTISPECIES: primosomal protein DnaI [Carnobacterium]MCO6018113.1 primosomal protein DnaI [Carnobacterium divergens]MDT1938531.1 primosomal protein DnaI [Carnobacterium divergens]MDT1940969.1 primosomal protein DnaI [Carnobacterium divergens]MDT1946767.1 primosomal protein DnaI [Carnobacterium divergens]MDT1949204.1 primosomal protein DnaI [Carnobacterium divergens]